MKIYETDLYISIDKKNKFVIIQKGHEQALKRGADPSQSLEELVGEAVIDYLEDYV